MDHPGSEPEEQAYPLVFLVSDAASFISGHCLVADLGFTAGGSAGVVESPFLPLLLEELLTDGGTVRHRAHRAIASTTLVTCPRSSSSGSRPSSSASSRLAAHANPAR
jgi:hypothetical protein